MRTIETKVYTFDELSEEAKETAIENIRNNYYEHNDFAEWAIDDCGLFEPLHKELTELLGAGYKFPLLENTRNELYFDLDRGQSIDISNAMIVTNDDDFFKWLSIEHKDFEDEEGLFALNYKIGKDTIEFELDNWSDDFTDKQEKIIKEAVDKFEEHCMNILERISKDIEYRFTDEAITEDIEANELEFEEDGSQF
jgi:hypothetical protein